MQNPSIITPQRLRRGDTIGFIAPASCPDDVSRIEKAKKYFESKGFPVKLAGHVGERRGYLAGSDAARIEDITEMFADPTVRAVLCVRGGYGAPRLLPDLPYNLIRANPKIFVGYSDITSLHSALLAKCGLVTFAGPMPAVDFWSEPDSYTEQCFWEILTGRSDSYSYAVPDESKLSTVVPGIAEGWLFGGNAAVLCGILGSPYVPDFQDAILYLEDVDEPPYRLDRFFNQLKLAGVFEKVRGVLLGEFSDCNPPDPNKPSLSFDDVIQDYFGNLKVPVLLGFPHGHIKKNATLPHGVRVRLDATAKSLSIIEKCVV